MDGRPAAKAKRERKQKIRIALITARVKPTNHPGSEEVRMVWRRALKARRKPSDGSAAMAAARHRIDRMGKPRRLKVERKPLPLSPLDHIHPRHRREWMRAHA